MFQLSISVPLSIGDETNSRVVTLLLEEKLREIYCVIVFVDNLSLQIVLLHLLVSQVLFGILVHLE